MNDLSFTENNALPLQYSHWTFELSSTQPTCFELRYLDNVCYTGTLEVLNNGQMLSFEHANWRFRHKPQRVEQWCQLLHGETLSINMNYYFLGNSLVIEYLARNGIPTRLDIRHAIESRPNIITQSQPFPISSEWQHERHGLPSEFLVQNDKTDLFREAFVAKQWIVLEKM